MERVESGEDGEHYTVVPAQGNHSGTLPAPQQRLIGHLHLIQGGGWGIGIDGHVVAVDKVKARLVGRAAVWVGARVRAGKRRPPWKRSQCSECDVFR